MAKAISIEQMGDEDVYDIGVEEFHNFFANGIVVHNCMRIARELAGFTMAEANKLRKGMGKKKKEIIADLRKKFMKGAQVKIDAGEVTLEEVETVFRKVESFAKYGFNKSVDKDTKVAIVNGDIRRIEDVMPGELVWCFDGQQYVPTEVVALHNHGFLPGFEVEFDDGSCEVCSINHKFLTRFGQVPLRTIVMEGLEVYASENIHLSRMQSFDSRRSRSSTSGDYIGSPGAGLLEGARQENSQAGMAESISGCVASTSPRGISVRRVLSIRSVGERQMYDLEVRHKSHNFVLASGLITSNSHAITYSALTCAELWLKYHYPLEFIAALINNTTQGKKKFNVELFPMYINYARKRSFEVLNPDINKSGESFSIEDGKIRFSLGHVKNVAKSAAVIIRGQPYKDMADFYDRAFEECVSEKTGKTTKRKINKKVVESLIAAGAFDCFGSRNDVIKQYYDLRREKDADYLQGPDKQWQELEAEILGVCLSTQPIKWKYEKLIKQNHWATIETIGDRDGRTKIFGRISSIYACTSKKGNPQLVVTITDDLDSFKFYVFGGGMIRFKEEFKLGDIAAIPLNKFQDGDTRFYDVDKDGQIVESRAV